MAITQSGQNYIDALLSGNSWADNLHSGFHLDYTLIARDKNNQITHSVIDLDKNYKAALVKATEAFASVSLLTFEYRTPSFINADYNLGQPIVFDEDKPGGTDQQPSVLDTGLLGITSSTVAEGTTKISKGDITISNEFLDGSFAEGGVAFYTIMHELGHALGLSHPADSGFSAALPDGHNNMDAAIMVDGFPNEGTYATALNIPTGLQIYDIAALQHLYGVNRAFNGGDTVHQISGALVAKTIWDGGGNDTLSASTITTDVIIDLREGVSNVSQIGESRIWLAIGANIEGAEGGEGDDTMDGNFLGNFMQGGDGEDTIGGGDGSDNLNGNAGVDVVNGNKGADIVRGGKGNDIVRGGKGNDVVYGDKGNDVISGDRGDDTLIGGEGLDHFHFAPGGGLDVINDFEGLGSGGVDRISVSTQVFHSPAWALANVSYTNGNAFLNLQVEGDLAVFIGIDGKDKTIDAGDFLFY